MERTGHTENVFNTVNKPNISDKNLYNNLQYNAGPGGGRLHFGKNPIPLFEQHISR